MRTHKLKTWPGPFERVLQGVKHAEFRFDDRGYRCGDTLNLREWIPPPPGHNGRYTGREIFARVTDVTVGFGIPDGFVMLSIVVLEREPGEDRGDEQPGERQQ